MTTGDFWGSSYHVQQLRANGKDYTNLLWRFSGWESKCKENLCHKARHTEKLGRAETRAQNLIRGLSRGPEEL